HLWHNRLRTGRLARSAEKLVRRMGCCGTAPILMKGIHTAYAYYPDPAARVMSDIDVVVAPADVTAAEHALRELGYTCVIARRPPVARSTWQREGQPSVPRSLMLTHAED